MANSDILPTNTTEIPKDLQVTALQACIGVIEDCLDNDISQSEISDIGCNSISVLPKQKRRWPDHLPEVVFMYNATLHSSTDFSPFYLMLGRHPKLPIDLMMNLQSNEEDQFENLGKHEYIQLHLRKMKLAHEKAGEKLRAEAVKRSSEQKYTPNHVLLEGSNVLLRNRVIGRNKIQDAWDARKYIIIKRIDPNKHVYFVEPLDGGERRIENRMNIKPCVLVSNDLENERRESKGQRLRNSIQCPSNEESDNESHEDDPIAIGYEGSQPLRRSARSNVGTHSNVHHLPR
ncbi:unnamed protein product [Mytilus coruscus]|uniref:Uncharacterized protein n=1 Tax=Mytilus coruscus TaxID=42192 RepID=A0A6J8F274_MYTCO|nr:unnamed protein product [Mytilus coruscus]